jgi:hypothetical protein
LEKTYPAQAVSWVEQIAELAVAVVPVTAVEQHGWQHVHDVVRLPARAARRTNHDLTSAFGHYGDVSAKTRIEEQRSCGDARPAIAVRHPVEHWPPVHFKFGLCRLKS